MNERSHNYSFVLKISPLFIYLCTQLLSFPPVTDCHNIIMRTKYDDYKEECIIRHKMYHEIMDKNVGRYTEEELEEIECREAYFEYGEYTVFPEKDDTPWNGMVSKLYDEGLLGDRVVYHAGDVLKTMQIQRVGDRPEHEFLPWDVPEPNITMADSVISNYRLLRRNVKMMRNTPGAMKRAVKPPPGSRILPDIKLHPRVEEVMRSLLTVAMKKHKAIAKGKDRLKL